MEKDLAPLFNPKSIAIIGASKEPSKLGAILLKNLKKDRFQGEIYLINPKYQEIDGLKCFADINLVPNNSDLVLIATPAIVSLKILSDLKEGVVKNAVLYASGFTEQGNKSLQDKLKEICQTKKINLLGPNCFGFANTNCNLNATFGESKLQKGDCRFILQSGATASSLFDYLDKYDMGFESAVTLGNKTIINENDLIEYYLSRKNDGNNHPLGLYLESISDGQNFIELAKKYQKIGPIFILKPGKTKEASKAMLSHTGSLAGEDFVLDSILSQNGIIRCQTLEEFFDFTNVFSNVASPKGKNAAIVTNAGGPGVIATDSLLENDLKLAEISPNPLDVLGDADAKKCVNGCELNLKSKDVDILVTLLTPQTMTPVKEIAEGLVELRNKYKKPILASFIGGEKVYQESVFLNKNRVPCFDFPEKALRAISVYLKYLTKENPFSLLDQKDELPKTDTTKIAQLAKDALKRNEKILDQENISRILSLYKIKEPKSLISSSLSDVDKSLIEFTFPIVLKTNTTTIAHKKIAGGVITNIRNSNSLKDAFNKISNAFKSKVIIQEQIENGIELIIGAKRDLVFGPFVLFGLGGSYAEVLQDRNIITGKFDQNDIRDLISSSKAFPFIKDFPLDDIYKIIRMVFQVIVEIPEVSDFEINPVIINKDGTFAVDTKIIIHE